MKKIIIFFCIGIKISVCAMGKELVEVPYSKGTYEQASQMLFANRFLEQPAKEKQLKQKLQQAKKDAKKILGLPKIDPLIGFCRDESKIAFIDTITRQLIVMDKNKRIMLRCQQLSYIPNFFTLSPSTYSIAYVLMHEDLCKKEEGYVLVVKNTLGIEHRFGSEEPYFFPKKIDFDETGEFVYVQGTRYVNGRYERHQQPFSLYKNVRFAMEKIPNSQSFSQ